MTERTFSNSLTFANRGGLSASSNVFLWPGIRFAQGASAPWPKEATAQPAAPAPAATARTDAPVHLDGAEPVVRPLLAFSDVPGRAGAEFVTVRLGTADLFANRPARRTDLVQN